MLSEIEEFRAQKRDFTFSTIHNSQIVWGNPNQERNKQSILLMKLLFHWKERLIRNVFHKKQLAAARQDKFLNFTYPVFRIFD